jgi:hypothetical protein
MPQRHRKLRNPAPKQAAVEREVVKYDFYNFSHNLFVDALMLFFSGRD